MGGGGGQRAREIKWNCIHEVTTVVLYRGNGEKNRARKRSIYIVIRR